MKIYGLTGSIASGKSTVSDILNTKLKVNIIDADLLARKAVERGSFGLKRIVQEFGEEVLLDDKSLNRKKLGDMVFSQKERMKNLNDIVHPEVNRLFKELVQKYKEQGCRAIIYDCPLLIEENLVDQVDEVILVITSEKLQLERLMSRNEMAKEEALQRIKTQIKMEEKIKFADYIIYNDGGFKELNTAVLYLWTKIIDPTYIID